jgi:outer membrane immunogenic protein
VRGLLRMSVALTALLAGASAFAADLPPSPAPVKAVSFIPVTYNWTGFYIGANLGGDWARAKDAITVTTTGAAVTSGTTQSSGFLAGGQAGINWQFHPNWVIGVEADGDWLTNSSTVTTIDGAIRHDGRLSAVGTGRARLGVVSNNWMLFGTGGFAWSYGQVTRTQITGTVGGAGPQTVETVTNTRVGWSAGGGVEYGFAANWTARAEYLFLGLDKFSYTFPIAGRTTASTLNINEGRVALNYKFGPN